MFDFTINLSVVLQTIVTLLAVGVFILRLHFDLRLLIHAQLQQKEKIIGIETRLDQLGKVLIDLAKQDQRLNNVEARLQDLYMLTRDKVS